MPSFFLAWQYLSKHRLQVMVMIAGVALALFLPLATHWLIDAFDQAIKSRAKATPLVLGAKGSRFDLVLHSLYFRAQVDDTMTQGDLAVLRTNKCGKNLAYSIPIYRQFNVRKKPLVGTSLDYFSFRKLRIAEGKQMALLGDCVLGAKAAAELADGRPVRSHALRRAWHHGLEYSLNGPVSEWNPADPTGMLVVTTTRGMREMQLEGTGVVILEPVSADALLVRTSPGTR